MPKSESESGYQAVGDSQDAPFTLKLHRGEGMVMLAMNWKRGEPPKDFVGFAIEYQEPESDRFEIQLLPARLVDTLEKLSVLNEAGGHPTEIVGLSSNADFLIAKQPLAFPYKDYQKDREVATKAVGGIVPLFTNLERQVALKFIRYVMRWS